MPRKQKTYECLHCHQVTSRDAHQTFYYKYCSNRCQADYKWEHVTKPRIERGECNSNSTNILKHYLIEKHGETCTGCQLGNMWYGKPITLHLDHVDGNCENNKLTNLRLLCPNCHSQTPTFGSKSKRKAGKRKQYYKTFRDKTDITSPP